MASVLQIAVFFFVLVVPFITGAVTDDSIQARDAEEDYDKRDNNQHIIINPLDDPSHSGCNYSTVRDIVAEELEGVKVELGQIKGSLDDLVELLKDKPGTFVVLRMQWQPIFTKHTEMIQCSNYWHFEA